MAAPSLQCFVIERASSARIDHLVGMVATPLLLSMLVPVRPHRAFERSAQYVDRVATRPIGQAASVTLSAGASKCDGGRLRRLTFSAGYGHHTPSTFYSIHTDSGTAYVQQSR
jgi:hypothetical protein